MKININNINKKHIIINVDKNKSLYSVQFPISHKSLSFTELKPGIYKFERNMNESLIMKENKSLL